MDLAFNYISARDSKLRMYSAMLAKLCLEKEPETFLLKRQHVLVELIDAFMESDDDRRPDEGQMKAASEALAALHVAIKNSIKVGSTQFNPEITVL